MERGGTLATTCARARRYALLTKYGGSGLKVSIITAVRNGVAAITPTLRSVREQNFPNVEHIVIDGASTDGTLEILEQEERHIAFLRSGRDLGVYDAFNKGLLLATGDVVAYLNAGDTYASRYVVAEVVQRLERSDADALFGDVAITRDIGGPTIRRYRSSKFSPERIARGFMPAHPAQFIRRRVYDRYGTYNASYMIAGDFEFIARAFRRGGASYEYLPEILTAMPVGGLSSRGWRSYLTITREMTRACKANGIRTNSLLLLARLPMKYFNEVLWRS